MYSDTLTNANGLGFGPAPLLSLFNKTKNKKIMGHIDEMLVTKANIGGSEFKNRAANAVGSGIAAAAVIRNSVEVFGDEVVTTMDIDLDKGLASGGTANDVIGTDGGAANAYIMELTEAVNGLPYKMELFCTEVPAGGDPDINLVSSATGTDAENAAVTSGTVIMNNGDLSAGFFASAGPGATVSAGAIAKKFLYLVAGDATEAAYTAGKIRLKVYGLKSNF